MLEALAAIGLAGNVIQLVQFSLQLADQAQQIRLRGYSISILDIKLQTEHTLDQIDKIGNLLPDEGTQDPEQADDDKLLRGFLDECRRHGNDLLSLLPKKPTDQSLSMVQSIKVATKQKIYARKIDDYTASLNKFREQISFHILISLRQTDAKQIPATSRKLESIQNDIKTVISLLDAKDKGAEDEESKEKYTRDKNAEKTSELAAQAREEAVQRCVDLPTQAHLDRLNDLTSERNGRVKQKTIHSRETILNLLMFRHISDRFDEVADAYNQTFDWVFDSPDNASWNSLTKYLQRDSDRPYWINGKAGSGKSTLMRYLARHVITKSALQDWQGDSQLESAHFFSWYLGTKLQKSRQGLLQALLYQILGHRQSLIHQVFPNIWQSIDPKSNQLEPLSHAEVRRAFTSLLQIASGNLKLCLFIDGIDEFDSDHEEIATFLRELSSSNVKIILSSRPIPACVDVFGDCPSLRLQDLTQHSIRLYVHGKLENHRSMQALVAQQPQQVHDLVQEIKNMASGVFLWVKLVVASLLNGLRNGDRVADLQVRLRALPPDLEDLFKYMLARVEPMYQTQAAQLFQLVRAGLSLLPDRALPIAFLSFADLDPKSSLQARICDFHVERVVERCQQLEKRLRSRCCGLLELVPIGRPVEWWSDSLAKLNTEDRILICSNVQYLHRTVAEFLYKKEVWDRLVAITASTKFSMHRNTANACLHMLKLSPFTSSFAKHEDTWLWAKALISCERQYENLRNKTQEKLVDEMDRVMTEHCAAASDLQPHFWGETVELRINNGCGTVGPFITRPLNSFLSLAASAGLFAYVDSKLRQAGFDFLSLSSQSILLQTMFAHLPDGWTSSLDTQVKVLHILLRNGADPNEAPAGPSFWQFALRYLQSMQEAPGLEAAYSGFSRLTNGTFTRKSANSISSSMNNRNVAEAPAFLCSLLQWGEVAKLCLEFGAHATEVAAFRVHNLRMVCRDSQISNLWPLFVAPHDELGLKSDESVDDVPSNLCPSRQLRLDLIKLGTELESMLVAADATIAPTGTLSTDQGFNLVRKRKRRLIVKRDPEEKRWRLFDLDTEVWTDAEEELEKVDEPEDSASRATQGNGYSLDHFGFFDVLFPELEHQEQGDDYSSDSGLDGEAPPPVVTINTSDQVQNTITRILENKLNDKLTEIDAKYMQFSGNPDSYKHMPQWTLKSVPTPSIYGRSVLSDSNVALSERTPELMPPFRFHE